MRLIDAEQFLADESEAYMSAQIKIKDGLNRAVNEVVHKKIQMLISDAPTVDAVEVVRCKDCKYLGMPFCKLQEEIKLYGYEEDWFCADGEREKE